ncbi:bcl-2-binding component 3 [Danio rerio]|uniref:Bbc3 protein n=1 Tax=Danio rerio TaxID=7955 RepID=Q0GKC9_DANRE|nr:bcl-2-binding component 3 [Danio rerio]AAI39509.1 Bbc3 protein [Danio rerio]ABI18122.1 Puma [Danio rerio]|eukprot:NP_001038937.1 BCL2 binding component 3 [Danio rerio]
MARPEMESRVDEHNSGTPNSCRMEVLRQDAWPNGSIIQPCHRRRTIATQTSTLSAPLPHIPSHDAFSLDSVQQQDSLLRDNSGTEQEVSRPLPLPDLLADNQSSSEESTSSSSSTAEDDPTLEEQAVERVAVQLRTIGDEMNAVFLQRNAVPHWQNWRGLYRGLMALVSDTINALYQHGLR